MNHKQERHTIYQYHPKLFHDYFPNISENVVNSVSEAGSIYHQFIMALDAVVDDNEHHIIFKVLELQERAIKKLSSIYAENHEFWTLLDKRKKEHISVIQEEKDLWKNPSLEKYYDVAAKKSSIGKVAIDALFVLDSDRNTTIHNVLLESYYNFSAAIQVFDDLSDFKEDFNKKQFNGAVYELSKTINLKDYDLETLNKLLYIEGAAAKLLNDADLFLDKAKKDLPDSNTLWYTTIAGLQRNILMFRDNVNGYLGELQTKK